MGGVSDQDDPAKGPMSLDTFFHTAQVSPLPLGPDIAKDHSLFLLHQLIGYARRFSFHIFRSVSYLVQNMRGFLFLDADEELGVVW